MLKTKTVLARYKPYFGWYDENDIPIPEITLQGICSGWYYLTLQRVGDTVYVIRYIPKPRK